MENFSMALLEAVSSGIPILAFDTGGNAEIVASGINGFLVPEGDLESLCDRAQQLLNPTYLNQLRESALKYGRNNFASHTSLNKYLELIESI
jgi:glycosyltransferase involved in cell wall biosynthesis